MDRNRSVVSTKAPIDKAASIATSRGRKLEDKVDKVDIEGRARPATSVFRGPRKEVVLGRGLAGKPRARNNHLRKYPEHSWTWTSQSVKVPLYLDFTVLEDSHSGRQIPRSGRQIPPRSFDVR